MLLVGASIHHEHGEILGSHGDEYGDNYSWMLHRVV
jgi:hypothetical protein